MSTKDLEKHVQIRGVSHTVPLALTKSLGHTCYHIGQIIQLARFYTEEEWKVLTIPKGHSEAFNRKNWGVSGKSHS